MVKTTLVKISQLKPNPSNPRLIKDAKFKKLVKSLKEFPEMLELRPIVANKDMIVLGGNMRLLAATEAGHKEVPAIIAKNLTTEQERQFIIKDNASFGEWDWQIIKAQNFLPAELADWGIDVPQFTNDLLDIEPTEGTAQQGYKAVRTGDNHSAFELVMRHENKLALVSKLNAIKTACKYQTLEEAMMHMVNSTTTTV